MMQWHFIRRVDQYVIGLDSVGSCGEKRVLTEKGARTSLPRETARLFSDTLSAYKTSISHTIAQSFKTSKSTVGPGRSEVGQVY
jgi:hypothetical protein